VLKSQPLAKALPTLAAGANNLVSVLQSNANPTRMVDTTKQIRMLTLEDWRRVLVAFEEWPFAPSMLFLSDTYSPTTKFDNR